MSGSNETYLANSFFSIHSIITRGLKVSITEVQEANHTGFKDEAGREGLFNYIRALTSILNGHHISEDEIMFPYFRELMPEAPFDRLIDGHQQMVKIMAEIKTAVEKCDVKEPLEADLNSLVNALVRLNASWNPHIQMETVGFISKADALIPVEEQLRLVGLMAEHGQKTSGPPFLTIPFMIYNLPPEHRAAFTQGMPAEVIEHLVPVVWKAQWESMKPYLLP